MTKLTLCYKFYENHEMLALQYKQWASYPKHLKDQIEIVLVDDGTPSAPAKSVPRPSDLPDFSLYRIQIDKPWNQNAATNLGAFVAKGDWLLVTDMDHMVSTDLLSYLLSHDFKGSVYMFGRVDAPAMTVTLDRRGHPKPHPNSYLITKKLYWDVGGHDEYFCGHYGTDRLFRNRIRQKSPIGEISVPLIRYGREVVADASTTTLPRKENRNPKWLEKLQAQKRREMDEDKILTLQSPWVKETL